MGGANQSGASKNAAKLDAQTEAGRLNTVSSDMRKVIQQGRQAKKWSQTQLANAINQPPKTVQEYENGKAVEPPDHLKDRARARREAPEKEEVRKGRCPFLTYSPPPPLRARPGDFLYFFCRGRHGRGVGARRPRQAL